MMPFWEHVVEPVARALHPRTILHFGARRDGVVERLAVLAASLGADLHVAAVQPELDFTAARKVAGDRLIVHRAPGPQVIALMPAADLALIDDDPNWFTVHGLLMALRERAVATGRGFPATLVAYTGWPFGRRDSMMIRSLFRSRSGMCMNAPGSCRGRTRWRPVLGCSRIATMPPRRMGGSLA